MVIYEKEMKAVVGVQANLSLSALIIRVAKEHPYALTFSILGIFLLPIPLIPLHLTIWKNYLATVVLELIWLFIGRRFLS